MSPNQVFLLDDQTPENAITERALALANADGSAITYDVDGDGLVMAIKSELLVLRSIRNTSPILDSELSQIARNCGTLASIAEPPEESRTEDERSLDLYRPDESGPAGDVEIWRLTDPNANSIDEARRLRTITKDAVIATPKGPELLLPSVSPHHLCIVSPANSGCPAGPPLPALAPVHGAFVDPVNEREQTARVVVIDTGYMYNDPPNPPHATLDQRVTPVRGWSLNTTTNPATWVLDQPDEPDADRDGALDGVAGHGTFNAGLIAHGCRQSKLVVVGQRDDIFPITPNQPKLFASEVAVARALLVHCNAHVIQCGFSFPTLDDKPSIPFALVMQILSGPGVPVKGVAVVAPAGNEQSKRRYWPAALPDVIGVAATNRRGTRRAHFSNWGRWLDCCTRGEDVYSTYIWWDGPVDGDPPDEIESFMGWAHWDGTSFAAPKVSAAIAKRLVQRGFTDRPVDAFRQLRNGTGGVPMTPLTDMTLSGFPGVTLPNLHLG